MFDLTDGVAEDIIFAMEDQERGMVVDLETGEVLSRELAEESEDEDLEEGGLPAEERFADPPEWSSREGFKLMEDFLALVRQPSARHELQAALSRGRGVFKTFKAVLAGYPEIERAFHEHKLRVMRRPIAEWYDDRREALGLARLGPEPEETDDLVASDFDISVLGLAESRGRALGLLAEAAEEAIASLPAPLVAFESERLRAELEGGAEGLAAFAEDGEGGALGFAIALRSVAAGRCLGRVVFLGVREGYRRIGLGGALLEAAAGRLSAEGAALVVVDSAFIPQDYGDRLAARGFAGYGVRAAARGE